MEDPVFQEPEDFPGKMLTAALPDPVRMPDTYSVSYHRMDKNRNEVITLLERDADGNIHYLDGWLYGVVQGFMRGEFKEAKI